MIPTLPLGLYKHYKGNTYRVVAVARHSETKEFLVVYQTLDASEWWVRPFAMFTESIIHNGREVKRFIFISH